MIRRRRYMKESYSRQDLVEMVAELEEYVKEDVEDQTMESFNIRAMQTNMGSYDLFELVIYDARSGYIKEIGAVELKYENNQWNIKIHIKYKDSVLRDNITATNLNDVKEYIVEQIMNFYWYELPDDWV